MDNNQRDVVKNTTIKLQQSKPALSSSAIPSLKGQNAVSSSTTQPSTFIIGQRVLVDGSRRGTLQFLGETKFAPGKWAGIELQIGDGKNDGSVAGERYFECEANHGLFTRISKLSVDPNFNALVVSPPEMVSSVDVLTPSVNAGSAGGNTAEKEPYTKVPPSSTKHGQLKKFKLGDRVIISSSNVSGASSRTSDTSRRLGTLRYVGEVEFTKGEWAGIEMDSACGKNDGQVENKRYFQCDPNFGIFVPIHRIQISPKSIMERQSSTLSSVSTIKPTPRTPVRPKMSKERSDLSTASLFNSASKRGGASSAAAAAFTEKRKATISSIVVPEKLKQSLRQREETIDQIRRERTMDRQLLAKSSIQTDLVTQKLDDVNFQFLEYKTEKEVEVTALKEQLKKFQMDVEKLKFHLKTKIDESSDLNFELDELRSSQTSDVVENSSRSVDDVSTNVIQKGNEPSNIVECAKIDASTGEELNLNSKFSESKIKSGENFFPSSDALMKFTLALLSSLDTAKCDDLSSSLNTNLHFLYTTLKQKFHSHNSDKDDAKYNEQKGNDTDNILIISNLKRDITNFEMRLSQRNDEFNFERQSLSQKVDDLQSSEVHLRIQNDRLCKENLKSRISLAEKDDILDSLKSELSKVQDISKAKEDSLKVEISNSKKELSGERDNLVDVTNELKNRSNEVTSLKSDLEIVRNKLHVTDEKLVNCQKETDKTISDLNHEIDEHVARNAALDTKLRDLTAENDKKANEAVDFAMERQQEIEQLRNKLASSNSEFTDKILKLEQSIELKNDELSEQKLSLDKVLHEHGASQMSLEKDNDSLECEVATLRCKIDDINSHHKRVVDDLNVQIDDCKSKLCEQIENCDKVESRLVQELSNSKKDHETYISAAKIEVEKLTEANEKLKSEVTSVGKESDVKEEEFNRQIEDMKKVHAESVKHLKDQCDDHKAKEERMRNQLHELETSFLTSNSENDCNVQMLNDKNDEIKRLTESNDSIKHEMDDKLIKCEQSFAEQVSSLKSSLEKKDNEIKELGKDRDQVMNDMSMKITELSDTLQKTKSELEKSQEHVLQRKAEFEIEMDNLRQEWQNKLLALNISMNEKDVELRKQLEEKALLEDLRRRLEDEVKNSRKLLDRVVIEKAEQSTENEALSETISELTDQVMSHKIELNTLTQSADKYVEKISHLECCLKNKHTELERLFSQVELLEKSNKDSDDEVQTNLKTEITDLQDQLARKEQELDESRQAAKIEENSVSTKISEEKKIFEDVQFELKQKIDKLTSALEKERSEKAEETIALSEKHDELLSSNVELSVKLAEVETAKEYVDLNNLKMDERIKKLTDDLKKIEEDLKLKCQDGNRMEEELSQLEISKETLQSEKVKLLENVEHLNRHLLESKNNEYANLEKISALKQSVALNNNNQEVSSQNDSEIEKLRSDLKSVTDSCCTKDQFISSLQSKIHELSKEERAFTNNEKVSKCYIDQNENITTQVDFLNSVIVDLKKKNDVLTNRIEIYEKVGFVDNEDMSDIQEYLINGGQSNVIPGNVKPPRLFCDICDSFDLHDTELCPKQKTPLKSKNIHSDVSPLPPLNFTQHNKRLYCDLCEMFGHDTENCDESEMY